MSPAPSASPDPEPREPARPPIASPGWARFASTHGLLGGAALLFAALWVLAWELFAGHAPIHANDAETLARFGPSEAPFLIAAALVEGALCAWITSALARRWSPQLDARWRELLVKPHVTYAVLGGVGAALALGVALAVLQGHSITEDEKTYLYQAHLLLGGKLSEPVPPEAMSFWQPFIVSVDGKWSGQYFWAQPAALALGLLVHAPSVVSPIEAAVTVIFTGKLAAEHTGDDRVGVLAAALAALSPIVTLTAGTYHSANLSACCAAVSLWAIARLARRPDRRAAVLLGLATGVGFHNRVMDEAAVLAGAGLLMLFHFRRDPRGLVRALWPAVAASLPLLVLLPIVNRLAYGGYTVTGYTLFNGTAGWKTMGFGIGPFGAPHSVHFAAAKTMTVLVRLAFYETGSPFGFALLVLPVLGLVRRSLRTLAPLVVVMVYAVGYFFYAGASIDPTGPVYYLGLTPVLLGWIAMVAVELHDLCRATALRRLVPAFMCAQGLAAIAVFWPAEISYLLHDVMQAEDCEATARAAGVDRGLIFALTGPRWEKMTSWHRQPPLKLPPFDAPLLFARGRGLTRDLAAVRRFAGDRPVYLERCFCPDRSTVLRYDPERRVVSALDGRDERALEKAPGNAPPWISDYSSVFKLWPPP